MSIQPVESWRAFDAEPQHPAERATDGARFEEALASASRDGNGEISPTMAAEILRVKMLSSAVALGGDGQQSPMGGVNSVQGALNRFLAHMAEASQQGAAGAVAVSGQPGEDAAPVAEVGAESAGSVLAGEAVGVEDIIEKASRRYGVDRRLVKAVIKAESDFNPRAVSSAGAQGLMQLMPATARMLGVHDPFDPEQNVMAGTRFLKDLLKRYGGDVDSALAAYNWGPSNLDRSTGALPRETRSYLAKVKGYLGQYSA